jgi:hypothetical protein
MTVEKLIQELSQYPKEIEVEVWAEADGQSVLRDIEMVIEVNPDPRWVSIKHRIVLCDPEVSKEYREK